MKKLVIICLLSVSVFSVFAVKSSVSVRGGYGFDWYKYSDANEKGSAQYVPIHIGSSFYFNESSSTGFSIGVDLMLATRFDGLTVPACTKEKTVLSANPSATFTFRGQLSEFFSLKLHAGFRWKILTRQYTAIADFKHIRRGLEILAGIDAEFWFTEIVGFNLACNFGFGIANKIVSPAYSAQDVKLKGCFSVEPSAGVLVRI